MERMMLGIMFFIAFIIFMTGLIGITNPEFQVMNAFDFGFFAGELILVAGTCVIATGLPCAGALIFFTFTSFFLFSNAMLWVIFTPILVVMSFMIARLARGQTG